MEVADGMADGEVECRTCTGSRSFCGVDCVVVAVVDILEARRGIVRSGVEL